MFILVSRYFKTSQPQRIISGLTETFTKRYLAERTNEAEIRPEEHSEEAGVVVWRIDGMNYS